MNYIDATKAKIEGYLQEPITQANFNDKKLQLKQLKLLMLQFTSLPPSKIAPIKEEYELAIGILELEMELALTLHDEKSFEIAYLQSKQFYHDFKLNTPKKLYFIGLYLLQLLSNNRGTDFSTEIELINIKDLNDPNIKISRNLEQNIMEGNYKQIQNMKNSTDNFYNYYLNKFDDAIRFQIARSAEKAYDSLKINDAISYLMLNNADELAQFAEKQNNVENREIDWKIQNDRVYFIPLVEEKETIPAYRIIHDSMKLGIEMEKII